MATYVTLVNEVLRRMNEVQLDIAGDGFGDARNLQALAKDAVNASVREILQISQEWPFTVTTYTQTMTVGTGVYDFPADFSKADWDTFYIKRLSVNDPQRLPVLTYNDYIRHYRKVEDTSGDSGYAVPLHVYQTPDNKFGVTPLPDDVYEIEYRYWSFPSDMIQYNDTCVIPERFKTVVVDGAMMYMMRFRANDQSGEVHKLKFQEGIDNMRRLLLEAPLYVSSTVIAGRQFNATTGTK